MKRAGRKRSLGRTKPVSDAQLAEAIVRRIENRIYVANKLKFAERQRYEGWYRPPSGDDPGQAFPPFEEVTRDNCAA